METREYIHASPGDEAEEVRSVSGAYVLESERRIEIAGREVLVVLGHAAFDSSCCGAGGCRYALVPGYVVAWKARSREGEEVVTEVEPVRDDEARRLVRERIRAVEVVHQVDFW